MKDDATRKYFCETLVILLNLFLSFDGKSYKSAGSSEYRHDGGGMANYRGKALTTGCWIGGECGVKTELMDMATLTWSTGPRYPTE